MSGPQSSRWPGRAGPRRRLVIHRLDGGLTSLSYRPVGGDGDENKIHIQLLVAAQNGAGRAWAAGNGMWGCAAAGRAGE